MKSVASLWAQLAGLATTPLSPSHYVGLVRPLVATHVLKARVEAVHDEAPGVRTLVLRPGRGWRRHLPGQHVRVGVAIDGRIVTRTYSIASSPDRPDGCITITVKAQPDGRVSRVLVEELRVGAHLSLGLPTGEFVLGAPSRALFVTAGSGVTPIAAMLRALAGRGAVPDTIHLHYARTPADVIFGAELRELARAHPSYRLLVVHTAHDRRRFAAATLDELVPDWRTRETWACGPHGLLDTITGCFARAGRAEALHVERFRAAVTALPANATGGRVRFSTSQVETPGDAATPLLRLAEGAGLAVPSGCRMGICHTCDATLLAGCVRDLRTGVTIDEPDARVQICVCAAAGDVELAL